MKIGICTGGGDCPGLNAAIRAVVKHASVSYGATCIGILDSFNGLMETPPRVQTLTLDMVSDILDKGGTMIGTHNRGNVYSRADGQVYIQKTMQGLSKVGIDAMIVIGGEGTQGMAQVLESKGVPIVGIPKTIDNDLPGTEQTIGFSTCVEFVADSVMRLRSTAESHDRIMVVEVMGRDSGFIALHGGLAGAASVILIPEIHFSYEKIVETIQARQKEGKKYTLVVVSEGATQKGGEQLYEGQNTGVKNLGGIGSRVAGKLFEMTGVETRYTVLGHLQRGGAPNAFDKIFASTLGYEAVELVMKKRFGEILVQKDGRITTMKLATMDPGRRKIADSDVVLKTAEGIGINLGR